MRVTQKVQGPVFDQTQDLDRQGTIILFGLPFGLRQGNIYFPQHTAFVQVERQNVRGPCLLPIFHIQLFHLPVVDEIDVRGLIDRVLLHIPQCS
jgi:hypothetical protein